MATMEMALWPVVSRSLTILVGREGGSFCARGDGVASRSVRAAHEGPLLRRICAQHGIRQRLGPRGASGVAPECAPPRQGDLGPHQYRRARTSPWRRES